MRAFVLICSAALALTTLSGASFAQQKTAKACRQEWQANKAENQAKGITEKAYVADCRKGKAAEPAATAPSGPATTQAPAVPSARPAPTARTTTQPTAANEFASEAQAKARCPGAPVVWVNLKSKVYHFAGTKNYGNTKTGAYMCEQDAQSAGMRAAKNEKHPS
jgi:hypothetical protein